MIAYCCKGKQIFFHKRLPFSTAWKSNQPSCCYLHAMTPKILTCHKSLTWQRFYLSCIVLRTCYIVASCLDNLERTACLPISTAYILRSALNQQTSQCGKSYFDHEVYLKANQILLSTLRTQSLLLQMQRCFVNLTQCNFLHIWRFLFLPSGEIMIIFSWLTFIIGTHD